MLAPSFFASIKWEMPGEMLQSSAPRDLSHDNPQLHPYSSPCLGPNSPLRASTLLSGPKG